MKKLNSATLTKKEFDNLPHMSRKIYQKTAKERFAKLDSHLDSKHMDWKIRKKANNTLALCLKNYINKNLSYLKNLKEIKIIELGASLGAITTLFALRELEKFNLLKKTRIWLVDFNKKGLMETKRLNFDLNLITKEGKFGKHFNIELLKIKLKSAKIIKGDILKLPKTLPKFDIVLSGFVHHHLNLSDKRIACKEMENITKKNGFIGLGDLYFTYSKFIKWLKKHENEVDKQGKRILYAVESFISHKKHTSFFKQSKLQSVNLKDCYYSFYLKKRV